MFIHVTELNVCRSRSFAFFTSFACISWELLTNDANKSHIMKFIKYLQVLYDSWITQSRFSPYQALPCCHLYAGIILHDDVELR